jgi:polyisoprenoid-binding protein YceI
MWNRLQKVVLMVVSVSGMCALLIASHLGGPQRLAAESLAPGRMAATQRPEAPLHYSVVAERSAARYRVREQLASITFPSDAVGTTSAVTGSIALDDHGQVLPSDSRMTIDLRALHSDSDRRDNYVRRNTLETERYPMVVFIPTAVRGLPVPVPQSGTVSLTLLGDLTVRDVTRPVTWDATATVEGDEVCVQAHTALRFADFGLTMPRVASVLSVEDSIRLEVDLLLRRTA